MLRSHGVGWGCYNLPSTTLPRPCTKCWCYVGVTFLRPRSLDLAPDVDATLTSYMGWGGGGDVDVPSTTFPRPCTRCWCHDHMGWGGDVITFLRPRPLDLSQDVDGALTWDGVGWGGVGWGGDVNVPSATFPRPCARCWCYAHIGWGGVGMLTFLRPHSLDLAQDVDATLTLGGVGWGHANVHPTLHKTLMLHQWGGVGWGDDGAMITLIWPCARCRCCAQDAPIIMV